MNCLFCKAKLPDESKFCCLCGKPQKKRERRKRTRANGEGTVFRRGDMFVAEKTIGYEDGRRLKVKQGGFSTRSEALAYLPQLGKEAFEQKQKEKEKKIPALNDLYRVWEPARKKLSNSKQTAYRIAFNRIEAATNHIATLPVSKITIEEIQEAVDEQGISFYTKRDMKIVFSHLFDYAIAQQHMQVNLSQYVVLPELEEEEAEPFNSKEQQALWKNYAEGDTFTGYLLLMIYTGMMPGELLIAEKSMIDWEKQTIIGAGLKTKIRKKTPLVIPDIILDVLKDLCEYSKGKKILTMNKDKFYAEYKQVLHRCGCRDLPAYSCRHTMGTAVGLTDIPVSVQQKAMRHGNFKSTQRYQHPDVSDVLTALNSAFGVEKPQ